MHANTQPVATNNLPGAARAAVIAAIVILAAVAGFLTGNALQDAGTSHVGAFSAAESVYLDQGLRIARQEASVVITQSPVYEDLGLRIARQEASAVTTQGAPATWENDSTAPAPR